MERWVSAGDEWVPRQNVLKPLRAGDRAYEPSRHNDRSEQTTSDGSNEQDDEHGDGQRWDAHRTEDVVVVFNDGTRHDLPSEISGIVDRVPQVVFTKARYPLISNTAQTPAPRSSLLRMTGIMLEMHLRKVSERTSHDFVFD
jgi:hypothetical protein